MIEFAIDPTRLSRSLRMISVMKCEFTERMRSVTERRKFMCNRLGAEFQDVLESLFLNRAKQSRLRRRCHRGMWLTAQKRIFSKEVSGLNVIEDFLTAASALFGNFD